VTTVDARGKRCPAPVIDLARAMSLVGAGEVVEVLADDPAAGTDIPAWCRLRGHELLGVEPLEQGARYRVRHT
jgi:tRNA 2-thiouridine synthesizing protein A